MPDNIIHGPWGKSPVNQTEDRLDADEANNLMVHALTVDLCETLFEGISEAGFDNLEEMCYSKDLALIVQAIKSAIFKMQGEEHVLQEFSEHLFDWTDEGFVEIVERDPEE